MLVHRGKGYAFRATTLFARDLSISILADVTYMHDTRDIYQLLKLGITLSVRLLPYGGYLSQSGGLSQVSAATIWVNCLDIRRLSRNAKSIWIGVVGEDQRKSLKPQGGKSEVWEIHVRFFSTPSFRDAAVPRLADRCEAVVLEPRNSRNPKHFISIKISIIQRAKIYILAEMWIYFHLCLPLSQKRSPINVSKLDLNRWIIRMLTFISRHAFKLIIINAS